MIRLGALLGIAMAAHPVQAAPVSRLTPAGIVATAPAVPGDDTASLARAAAAYEAGRLTDALSEYEALATRFPHEFALCYNLGNTHWRLGRRGKAILWFERARRLSPRDSDARFNLALARSSLTDEEPTWGEAFDRVLTPRELTWGTVALLWLLCLGCGLALIREWPRERWRPVLTIGVPVLVMIATWLGLRIHDLDQPWAVVTVPTAEVRSGPGDQFPVGYTAPEGQRAVILNRRPGWIELGIPSKSLKGWVTESAVEKL